ncbi:peptidoglycan hydrolase [Leptolyngbya phage Lbo240-yong1]|uniref:Peptidoglycan hydrolase n=1 Tax=Leptolyngbya phage Lbo240-yong1 TaxID=2928836 RepID=A0A9X9H400_9CAUD|nr:peptidoglycan hydrolase [Leptolyngbya phage Lbo240-yong1]
MSDPIDNLRRKEQQEFTAILEGAQRQMPVQQTAPPPVAQPMSEAAAPPPPTLQQPVDTTNLFDGLNLEQPVSDLSVPSAGVRPSDVLQTVVQPDVQRDLTTQLTQRAINEGEVGAATQAGVMPYLFQPPNTEALRREFGNSVSWATRDLARMNIEARARQDANLQAQAEWSRQALEFLKSEEGKRGSTGDPFDWVRDIVGVKENGRTYLQPWNQQRGVSIPAALLYGLGVVQNAAVGAAMDVRGILSDIAKAVPPWAQVDPNKMPGWAQGLLNSADKALSQQVFGANAAVGSLTGMNNPARGMFRGVAEWLTTADRSITDKKSNVIEALRGAQYSFTDDVGSGVGIKVNRGFRVGAAPGKGFGFDVNPSVLAGFGLDVIAGNRADKIIDTGRIIFSPVRGAYRILRGKRPPDNLAQAAPTPTPPPKPSGGGSAVQLELPFLPNTPQAVKVKPKSPAQIEAAVLGSNLGAFKKANRVEAKRIETIRKAQERAAAQAEQLVLDFKPFEPKQLELALDTLPEVKVTATKPRVRKQRKPVVVEPQQLEIDFAKAPDPVQAIREVVSKLPETGNPAADAYLKATVVNALLSEADSTVKAATLSLDQTADVGRKFAGDALPALDVPLTSVDIPTVKPPENAWHGTRVEGLNLSAADPVEGAARSELGTGHYLSTNPDIARTAAQAISAENLPSVDGRVIGTPTTIVTNIEPNARLIDAMQPNQGVVQVAEVVSRNFPQLAGDFTPGRAMTLVEVYDTASRQLDEADALQFQRTMAKTLRDSGYDGAMVGDTVAIYNPGVIRQGASEIMADSEGVIPKLAARADLEAAAPPSEFSRAASADAEMRLAAQVKHEAQRLADEVSAQNLEATDAVKLWDDPVIPKALPGTDPGLAKLPPGADPFLDIPFNAVSKGRPWTPIELTQEQYMRKMVEGFSTVIDDMLKLDPEMQDVMRRAEEMYLELAPDPLPADLRNVGRLEDLSSKIHPRTPQGQLNDLVTKHVIGTQTVDGDTAMLVHQGSRVDLKLISDGDKKLYVNFGVDGQDVGFATSVPSKELNAAATKFYELTTQYRMLDFRSTLSGLSLEDSVSKLEAYAKLGFIPFGRTGILTPVDAISALRASDDVELRFLGKDVIKSGTYTDLLNNPRDLTLSDMLKIPEEAKVVLPDLASIGKRVTVEDVERRLGNAFFQNPILVRAQRVAGLPSDSGLPFNSARVAQLLDEVDTRYAMDFESLEKPRTSTVADFLNERGIELPPRLQNTLKTVGNETFEVNPIIAIADPKYIDVGSLSRVWGGMTEIQRGLVAIKELERLDFKGDLKFYSHVADMMTNMAYAEKWTGGYQALFDRFYDQAVKAVKQGKRASDNLLVAQELNPSNKTYDYFKAEADRFGNRVLYENSKDIPSLSGEEVALYAIKPPTQSAWLKAQDRAFRELNQLTNEQFITNPSPRNMGDEIAALSPLERADMIMQHPKPRQLPYDVPKIMSVLGELEDLQLTDTSRFTPAQFKKWEKAINDKTKQLDELTKQSPCGL